MWAGAGRWALDPVDMFHQNAMPLEVIDARARRVELKMDETLFVNGLAKLQTP